jgi:hypothetical protein
LNTIERGISYRKRVRWCTVNNPQIWPDDNYLDNDKTNDYIVSYGFINGILYVRFSNSLWALTYTSDTDNPFRWDFIADTGSYASHSTIQYNNKLLNAGKTSLIETDGRDSYKLNMTIPDETLNWNLAYISYSYGFRNEAEGQLFMSYVSQTGTKPDSVLVYNYENKTFSTNNIPAHCFGSSKLSADLILDNIETTLDDIDYSFDDENIQSG